MTPAEGAATDRLAHGEAVPGGPGACGTCHHAKVWHSHTNRNHPCERCDCASFTAAILLSRSDGTTELVAGGRGLDVTNDDLSGYISEREGALFYLAPADRLF